MRNLLRHITGQHSADATRRSRNEDPLALDIHNLPVHHKVNKKGDGEYRHSAQPRIEFHPAFLQICFDKHTNRLGAPTNQNANT